MAASTSDCSSLPNHTRFDVFLSFRGEDTRHSFTDHLYAALKRAGIPTFRDNDEIDRGQELKPEIDKAIRESRASIVVLSNNYANSRWCLNELKLILDQRRNFNHYVLPVFYHVDPSDVRNQRQSFAITAQGSKWTKHNVERWKAALAEVSNLTGLVVSGSETEFIANIVDTIYNKLDLKEVATPAHLTGIETRAEFINSWLSNEQSSCVALSICGMGGIGKTTLAQYIYNSNKHNFEISCLLEEITKHCEQPEGLLKLQKQLLTDVLGGNYQKISNVSEGTRKVEDALQTKSVLIVLDDISEHNELAALLGTKAFYSKTKIIITTRLLDIHTWFEFISLRCHMYKLELMNDDESLELLSYHAFRSKSPMEGFEDLAVQLARYCEGNPLALKVLGSSLYGKAEIETWKSTLNSLKGDVDDKIQGILRRSFDSLPRQSHRELFLHVSFFFVGGYEDDVVTILERDWHAKSGIVTLVNRCLLTVSPSNKLMMHQLLQEMARKIVHEKSKDPVKRSRVSNDNESYCVFEKENGSETIEGLALNSWKLDSGNRLKALKTSSLAKMDKLKLLKLIGVELRGSYNNFPDLTWLCWHLCPLKTIPSGLLKSSLVAIDMSYGNLKEFEPPTVLDSLKILNLRHCKYLISIRNFDRLPNLETLILWDCKRLTHVCETIGGLKSLAFLDLTNCEGLRKEFLMNQKHVSRLKRLKVLFLGGRITEQLLLPCSLKYLSLNCLMFVNGEEARVVSSGHQPLLHYLNLGANLFKFLPSNIDLKTLRVLDLNHCQRLKSLVCLPSTLEELYTYECQSLEKITFQSAKFRLREFGYDGCQELKEIQGLFKLVSVGELNEADLGHMKWAKPYLYHKVKLVGDVITEGRRWPIQDQRMLYEYGIMSTYLPGIKDEIMKTLEYKSSSSFLSFHVPSSSRKCRIKGLNVTSSYEPLSKGENESTWVLFTKISNITKGLTWMYNPAVYCKPEVGGEDIVWLSYWPIGNVLDIGDEVNVSIVVGNGLVVTRCGASLVYMEDGEAEEENLENNYKKEEEVIGGDLSEFELKTGGGYYLCRRDFIKSTIPDWLNVLLGHHIHSSKELQGWRKSRQSHHLKPPFTELKTYRNSISGADDPINRIYKIVQYSR